MPLGCSVDKPRLNTTHARVNDQARAPQLKILAEWSGLAYQRPRAVYAGMVFALGFRACFSLDY